jgi:putative ABC transport system substrate-binding protein
MKKNIFGFALGAMLLALSVLAEAQQTTKKIPRVGILSLNPASVQKDRVEAFREALRKLGYVEGQNITVEYRYADSKSERLPELAAELVALKVDVIVTTGNSATAPAKDATKAIPIVMMNDTDPSARAISTVSLGPEAISPG